MRILVTGGSGFVGASVIRRLAGKHTVVGLSRRESPGAHESIRHDLSVPGVQPILDATFPCEVIVHAAAQIDMNPLSREVVQTNTTGALNVLELASSWGAYVIYLSSIQVIGFPHDLPVTEDHPTAPQTTYHATKLFGEHILAAPGRNGVALRLTAPVGVTMPRNRILPVFAERAKSGEKLILAGRGGRRQDYVLVDDIADAVSNCLKARPTGVYNLGSGVSISNLELARLCVETLNSRSEIVFGSYPDPEENAEWDVSVEKAQRDFGYTPHPDLRHLIRALAAG